MIEETIAWSSHTTRWRIIAHAGAHHQHIRTFSRQQIPLVDPPIKKPKNEYVELLRQKPMRHQRCLKENNTNTRTPVLNATISRYAHYAHRHFSRSPLRH
jgi:hypothetical protein